MAARVCVFLVILLWSSAPLGAVVASASSADRSVNVQLTDEKCKIPVPPGLEKHLTKHATWTDTKVYRGCWGEHPQSKDHVLLYFEDNSGGAVHRSQFQWAQRG